jgi:ribosomal protein S18 acetylase RimI-like enzyme
MFKNMGFTEAALGVDAENLSGALHLYKRCGYQVVKRESLYRKPIG